MRKIIYPIVWLIVLIILPLSSLFAQIKPEKVILPIHADVSKKLTQVKPILPGERSRSWKNHLIKNMSGFQDEFKNPSNFQGVDPVLQVGLKYKSSVNVSVLQNFPGTDNLNGVAPPDTDGDVSPDNYFQMVNLSFEIFDRSGNLLMGPYDNQTIWEGFDDGQPYDNANDGDPVVLYDQVANRWLVSQFAVNTTNRKYYELVAISVTSDPTGAWYRYAFQFNNMPDYPKLSVWNDGYYLTANQFRKGRTFVGGAVCILDRDAMLNGDPNARMLFFNLGTSYGSLLPADIDGSTPPSAGSPDYIMNLGTNSLNIWEAKVDWNNTANSSVTKVSTLSTQAFNYSGISITQPVTTQKLDDLASRLMYRVQYRNFGSYQVMLTNHTVNADGNGHAGVRWYELRNYGSGWSIYQQGTYAPADGNSRWMGSIAMNGDGDIALGYSVSGDNTYPSIRVVGQTAGAPDGLGVFDVSETTIKAGANSQTGVNRWGDYSMMAVDPVDDHSFWYTTEYSGGGWNWKTQIAAFNYGAAAVIAPVADFSGNPTTVSEGEVVSFTDQSLNNPTTWSWSFPGGTPSSSTAQNPSVTYNTAGVYDVTLTVTNSAGTDTKTISSYITVNAPATPTVDFAADITTLTVGDLVNFTDLSTGNPTAWTWTFAGGTPSNSNLQNPSVTYNTAGVYDVTLTASNASGSGTLTKSAYITVNEASLTYCASSSTSAAKEYIKNVVVGGFSNASGATVYSDFTGKLVDLNPGSSVSVNLTTGYKGKKETEAWRIWIDYNHNGNFDDTGELVFDAAARSSVSGSFIVPSGLTGTTGMRISMRRNSAPPSCGTFDYGEVEDYTANFSASARPATIKNGSDDVLKLYPNPTSGNFNILLNEDIVSGANIHVYNMTGRLISVIPLVNRHTSVDMKYLSKGIYQIVVVNGKNRYLRKILVE